ncbi:unnamed protein product [Notodromas monacha]|uniref:DUS-like FMN-binding domain-containing protein n=1 Tax=Notodromas monacha TaxID=399045 RepID=A0A7R9BHX1_9CRUS|nr:unnamed protein product [Notodromas monacha]CAG0914433.1 unnamed protein product [Notodromas monacha]
MLDYVDKMILAPMVRIGTLPMRLLALRYGADIVYCEELVDVKLLRSKRIENNLLGTVDYVDMTDGTVVFRTCAEEAGKVVLQIGTCCADRAAKIVDKFQGDVAGFDVNMGCPKEFSLKGGMGAALLDHPDKIQAILSNMIRHSKIPVTCKIRVKPCLEETKKLVKLISATGVAAIGVHGRTKDERPKHENRNDYIAALTEVSHVPLIANGGSKEIASFEDILKFKASTKAASVMIARAAEWNCSVFRREGMLSVDQVIRDYLMLCVDFDNQSNNSKYAVQNMLGNMQHTSVEGVATLKAQTLEELCSIWKLEEYFKSVHDDRMLDAIKLGPGPETDLIWSVTEPCRKKLRLDETNDKTTVDDVVEMPVTFVRRHYADENLPRTLLFTLARTERKPPPKFETKQLERLFKSVLSFDGKKWTSHPGEKSRRYAEQAASLVYLKMRGMEPETRVIRQAS